MNAVFQDPIFKDETAAREALEAVRWPDGAICPHCGNSHPDRIAKITTKSARPGLHYCNECKGQFTVTVGTVFERSKVPLTKWWVAAHMMNSSKKGVSAHEIHRNIGVTYKTAWFMMHRLREAIKHLAPGPMGGNSGAVQADETFYGNTSKRAKNYRKGHKHKQSVLALVDDGGKARAFHVQGMSVDKVCEVVFTNVVRKATLVNDEAGIYKFLGSQYADHQTVLHAGREYVNAAGYTTNNVENFFGQFQAWHDRHLSLLQREALAPLSLGIRIPLNNRSGLGVNDGERTALAMKGIEGKRLTYRPTDSAKPSLS